MRLAWTAIVPRSLVEGMDGATLPQAGQRVLTVSAHADPALRVVRCYQAQSSRQVVAPAEGLPAA